MKHRFRFTAVFLLLILLMMTPDTVLAANRKAVPGKVTITDVSALSRNKINIRWKKASNATHYKIYYKKAGSKTWKGVATVSSKKTNYTHTSSKKRPIVSGQKYTYTVRAYNKNSKKYGKYNTKGLTVKATTPVPGKVTLTKASAANYNKINIRWQKTSNATHYKIYYKKYGSKKWTRLATVGSDKTGYTHTSSKKYPITVGKKYTYTVKAYNEHSKKYGKYNTKGLTVKTVPETVKLKKATVNRYSRQITITWNKAKGCDRYAIYRKKGSSWKRIATVKSNVLKYTDKNPDMDPVKGKKNIYTVRGYDSKTKTYGSYDKKGISLKHSWKDTKLNPPYMDWSYSLQENTGFASTSEKISSIYACSNCGYLLSSGKTTDFDEVKYFNHIEDPKNSHCMGGYTVLHLSAIYELLECRHCSFYKRGDFIRYEYPKTPWEEPGSPVHILTPSQVKELGLNPNGK